MKFTRREFIKGGVAAFTVSFAAPAFLSDLARAQGASRRNLVVLYLAGGNDALSTLVPYQDPFYFSRRPTIAVPAGNVIQVGTDSSGVALGLHPRLTGPQDDLRRRASGADSAIGLSRTRADRTFLGTDIWSTAHPENSMGAGWLGRYLDALPSPVDPLVGWCTQREVPHTLIGNKVSVPAIPSISGYAFQSPNTGTRGDVLEDGDDADRLAPAGRSAAPVVRERHGRSGDGDARPRGVGRAPTVGSVAYASDGLSQALKAVAGAMVRGIGTKVFWVQIGGFDTHSNQQTNAANAGYANLMGSISTSLGTFYTDLKNQGLLQDTLDHPVLGVRPAHQRERQRRHRPRRGRRHDGDRRRRARRALRHGAESESATATRRSRTAAATSRYETDFRSVYARVIDNWLGGELGVDSRGGFQEEPVSISCKPVAARTASSRSRLIEVGTCRSCRNCRIRRKHKTYNIYKYLHVKTALVSPGAEGPSSVSNFDAYDDSGIARTGHGACRRTRSLWLPRSASRKPIPSVCRHDDEIGIHLARRRKNDVDDVALLRRQLPRPSRKTRRRHRGRVFAHVKQRDRSALAP